MYRNELSEFTIARAMHVSGSLRLGADHFETRYVSVMESTFLGSRSARTLFWPGCILALRFLHWGLGDL